MDEDEGNSGVSLSTIYKDLFHMNTSSFLYQRGDASFLWNGRNLRVEKAYGASVYLAAAGKMLGWQRSDCWILETFCTWWAYFFYFQPTLVLNNKWKDIIHSIFMVCHTQDIICDAIYHNQTDIGLKCAIVFYHTQTHKSICTYVHICVYSYIHTNMYIY